MACSAQKHPNGQSSEGFTAAKSYHPTQGTASCPQKLSTKSSPGLPSHPHSRNPIPLPLLPKAALQEGRLESAGPTHMAPCWVGRWPPARLWEGAGLRARPRPALPPHCLFVSRLGFPCLFPACTIVSLGGPVQTTELGTTFKPPTCQRLLIRSKACS